MRNHSKFFLVLAWSAMALTATGCTKEEEPEPEPSNPINTTLTIEESLISVPAEGGIYSVNYELTNPTEDGILTVVPESDEEWVSDFTINESASAIGFEVYANESENERSLSVTVSYTGLESGITFTIKPAESIMDAMRQSTLSVDIDGRAHIRRRITANNMDLKYLILLTCPGDDVQR